MQVLIDWVSQNWAAILIGIAVLIHLGAINTIATKSENLSLQLLNVQEQLDQISGQLSNIDSGVEDVGHSVRALPDDIVHKLEKPRTEKPDWA